MAIVLQKGEENVAGKPTIWLTWRLMDIHTFLKAHIWLVIVMWALWCIGFAIVYRRISWWRGSQLVEDWANVHHFAIVSIHQPMIVPLWRVNRGRQYMRATLQDASGQVRECWLGYPAFALVWFGKSVDYIEVIWDEKPSDQPSTPANDTPRDY